jgi:anti-sigma regulatory factor (Ser/Thr protein kinase)
MSAAEALLELAPDPTSPRKARAFIALVLHEWGCEEVEDRAILLVSEVVTNAVKHAGSQAVLSARYDNGRVEIRVEDDDDSLPTLKQADAEAESGRGLMVVNALADHWGIEPLAHGGKSVYFAFTC